jgi:hypothetical protein
LSDVIIIAKSSISSILSIEDIYISPRNQPGCQQQGYQELP